MKNSKCFAGMACAAVVFACALMAVPPVTAIGAEMAAAGAEMTAAGAEMTEADAARQETEAAAADAPDTDNAGARDGSDAGATATGTAVLLTAGVYTAARKQWNEKKKEKQKPKEYVYFENHTKNGTL